MRYVLYFLVVCLTPLYVHAEESTWTVIARADNYELYQKPSAGSADLVAFRLVGTLKSTPKEVATAILDREHRRQWMRDVRELRTVRLPSPGSVIEYSAVKTPFIIKDRDFVIRTDVEVDLTRQKFIIVSKSVVDPDVPETSAVRGFLTEGRFVIEPGEQPGTAKLTADMDVDPQGSVPRWIVNHFQKNWPIGMFRGLNRFLARKVATLPKDFQPLFMAEKIESKK